MQVTITNDWFTKNFANQYLEIGKTYDVNELVHHKSWEVRYEAAEHGYSLDVLINDKDEDVRRAVAKQGYGLDILIKDESWIVREAVAKQGYGLDILVNDEDVFNRIFICNYLLEHGYKSVDDWAKANPDKVHGNLDTETSDSLKDFVYKINDSNTLKVESSYESVEAFFNDSSKESYESNEALIILAVDTKVPLIKIEKSIKDENQVYKFIVDITNDDGDRFLVNSIISSKEKFNQLLESTINALNGYSQFSKYTSDLESCL